MILEKPSGYNFVFEPNFLKVTCENTTDPSKEVTVSGNGIVLKRNCHDSVATFDLSVIFESLFDTPTFLVNYSSVEWDMFYEIVDIEIIATDETTISETFKVRWGCYQFDEVKSNDDYTFPYWVGYPLAINSDKEYDHWYLSSANQLDYDNAEVDIIPIPTTTTEQFTHEVKLSGIKVQTVTYIPQTFPIGNYLQWVDGHGVVRHFMFYSNREKQIAKEIKSGELVPYYPTSLADSQFGRGKVIEKTKQRSFGCFQSVEETIYPIVESIASSPIVKYWTNNKWIEVKIKDMTIEPLKRGYVDIEFTVELPKDFNQRR